MVHEQEYTEELQRADQEEARTGFIKAREQRGLSQEWMAENAGYSLTQYVRIENGEREITGDDLWQVAMAIDRYDASLKSPFQRKLTLFGRQLNIIIFDFQDFLEDSVPGMESVFKLIGIRTIAIVTAFFIFMWLSNMTPYNIGFAFGRLARVIQLTIA